MGGGRLGPAALEHAQQQQELADKPVQARQADARQRQHEHEEGQHGQPPGQAAEVGDLPRVVALVDHAHHGEQPAGRQPVVDHLQHAALDAQPVQGEQAQHAEAQVADAGIGDQPLDVALGQGHQRPVDDAGHARATSSQGMQRGRGLGQHRQVEPQRSRRCRSSAARRPGSRCRPSGACDVGQRQPGVQREQRHLDGKAGKQGQEDPDLHRRVHRPMPQAPRSSSGIENVIFHAAGSPIGW